jgi:hypothetical protein
VSEDDETLARILLEAEDDEAKDETLARMLLCGFVGKDKKGLLRQWYFGDRGLPEYLSRSGDESEARAAIVRLLRSNRPLSRDLRHSLASLFDSKGIYDGIERKIVFIKRSTNQPRHMRNTEIVEFVRKKLPEGGDIGAAITAAANHFRLSEDAVKKIWHPYRRIFKDLYGDSKKGK